VTGPELLTDGFSRVREIVLDILDGLDDAALGYRADADANSIGWLIWHLTRVQDDHVAGAVGVEQVWVSGGWDKRFALPLETGDIGYGHSSDEVAIVRTPADLLAEYHEATYQQTVEHLRTLTDADMDTIVDELWDPPVTMGVRLVSVLSDDLQHAGQAAYIRGLVARRG
jgi:uncharacterized protein DUF664